MIWQEATTYKGVHVRLKSKGTPLKNTAKRSSRPPGSTLSTVRTGRRAKRNVRSNRDEIETTRNGRTDEPSIDDGVAIVIMIWFDRRRSRDRDHDLVRPTTLFEGTRSFGVNSS